MTEPLLEIYADNLEALPDAALVLAFERAEATAKFLPSPGELREMAGASIETLEQIECDQAWEFVQNYLVKHGPEGKSHVVAAEGHTSGCPKCQNGYVIENKKAVTCPAARPTTTRAPVIAERIRYALRQIANSEQAGLQAILDTEPKFQPKIRGQFNEGLKRAKVALRKTEELALWQNQ